MLTPKQEDSELTLEVRSGGIGTDDTGMFLGVPGVAMPGPIPVTLPEVRVYERFRQFGTAKIGLVAYETDTGKLVFDSGRHIARSDDSRWSVLGVGPFRHGSARAEIDSSKSSAMIHTASYEQPQR